MDEASRAARFEAAYRSLYGPVCGYVLRRVPAPEDAADVVAETFLTLWRRLDEAPAEPALRPWTYGVARRVIANQLRGQRRRHALAQRLTADFTRLTADLPDPAEQMGDGDRLRAAFAGLSDSDQEILALAAWEGLTPTQAAAVLGVRPAVARLRLHRARRRLRAVLDVDEPVKHPGETGQVLDVRAANPGMTQGAPR